MLSLRKQAARILRKGKNSHAFVCFINGKIRTFSTRIDDINSQVAELFGALNTISAVRALSTPVALAMMLALMPGSALALDANALPNPTTGTGISSITTTGNHSHGYTMTVTANVNKSILNYSSFDIGKKSTVDFRLPNSGSSILNRVTGGNMSQIYGTMTSNGRVFLVNPNGILFGNGANVSVNGLVASTLNITDQKFLAGQYEFSRGLLSPQRSIQIDKNATITTKEGGATFISSSFYNAGNITANGGAIQVGVGDRVTLGDDLVGITVNESLKNSLNQAAIWNTGNLTADQVKLVAAGLKSSILDVIVNNEGRISANKVVDGAGGSVELVAENGIVNNSGTIDASGKTGGLIVLKGEDTSNFGTLLAKGSTGNGGIIQVSGTDSVYLGDGLLDASGKTGGGSVLIGVDTAPGGALVSNTLYTYVGSNVLIKADALNSGNGGNVIVRGNDSTGFYGDISANGFSKGGFVETSGKYLDLRGNVSARALNANGTAGSWLINSQAAKIVNNNQNDLYFWDFSTLFTGKLVLNPWRSYFGPSEIKAGSINSALNGGTNVTVSTSDYGLSAPGGDLQVNSLISKTSGPASTLSLLSSNDLLLNSSAGISASGNGSLLNVILKADYNTGAASLADGNGSVLLNGAIQTNNGSADVSGVAITLNNSLNAGTGNVTMTASGGDITQNAGVVNGNDISMSTTAGDILQKGGSIAATNSINLDATGGEIRQSGGNMTGDTLNATVHTNGQGITVNNTNFNRANLQTNHGDIAYTDADSISVHFDTGSSADKTTTINAGGGIELRNNDAQTLGNQAGVVNLTASNGDITQNGSTLNANTANYTAKNGGVKINGGNLSAVTANLNTTNGDIALSSGAVNATNANLTANNGNIAQTGGTISGDSLKATTTSNGKSVTLSDADFTKANLTTNNGSIVYNDKDGVTVNVNAGNGNATITTFADGLVANNGKAEADLTLTGANTANNLTLTANGGNISQAGGSVTGDRLIANATAGGGSISLTNADFNKADLQTNFGDIQYQDTDGISVHFDVGGSANNTASITSNTGSDLNGNANSGIELRNNDAQTLGNQANTVNLLANAGDITQNGSTLNSHTANYTALNGNIRENGGLLSAVEANLNATNGDIITSAGIVSASTANLTTNNGNILQSGGATQANTLNMTTNNGNILQTGGSISGNTVNLNAHGAPALLRILGGKNLAIVLPPANNGNITQTGGTLSGNTLNATTTAAGKTINVTNADFKTAHLTSNNGNISYQDQDGVQVSVNADSADANITAGASGLTANNGQVESGIELIDASQAGKLNLTANGGNITQADGSTVSGDRLSVTTTNGSVTLDQDNANNFKHLSVNTRHGNVSYRDVDGINIASADLHDQGNLSIQTNGAGDITQTGSVKGVDTLSVITDQGNVNLNNGSNDANHLVALSNQGSVLYQDRNGIDIALAQLGQAGTAFRGNLSVQAGGFGNITQSSLISGVDTLRLRTDFGSASLTLANDVQKLDTGSNYGGSTTFNNAHGFELTGANTVMQWAIWKGDLNLSAQNGVITQSNAASAAINASEVKITGNAALNNAGNNTDVFSAFGNGAMVSYTDRNGFNLGRTDLGNGTLNLTANSGAINQDYYFPLLSYFLQNRNITDNGGITAGSVNLTLGSGANAYLTDSGNNIGNFSLLGQSSCVKLVNGSNLNLTGASDASGMLDVSVLNGRNLTQSGAVNLNGLKVSMRDGGDFTLTNANNDVRVFSANANAATTQGRFVDGFGGFALATSDMGNGDLALTALNGGSMTQGGLSCDGNGCGLPAGGIRADELKLTVIGGGDVDFTTQNNLVNTLSANARLNARNSQIQFTNNQDLIVANSNLHRGDLALNVNGNISQNANYGDITRLGIIHADELNVTLLNGGLGNLLNPNRVHTLSANSTGAAVGRIFFGNDRNLNIADSRMGAGDLGLIVNGNLRQDISNYGAHRHDITQAGIIQSDELALILPGNRDAILLNPNRVNALSVNALGFFGPRSSQILFGNAQDLNLGMSFLGTGDLGLLLYNGANLNQNHLATSRDIISTGGIFGNELSVNMLDGGSADLTSQFNHVDVFSGNAYGNSSSSVLRFNNFGDLNIARSDVGQGKLYISALGNINNQNLGNNNLPPVLNNGPVQALALGGGFWQTNRDITVNDSTIHGNVVSLTTYGNGSIDVYNNITATGPDSAVRLTTANNFGNINIHAPANVEARTGGVYLNTNQLSINGLVQGQLVQLWPWNLTLSMGIGGGSGGMQLSQNVVNHINTDSTLGLNTLMFGQQNYTGTITLGSLNLSGHHLTDVAFNAPRVFDATPNNDSSPNLIMAANRNVYLTAGADTVGNWASAPGGISYGDNSSRFADLDMRVSGSGLIHVRLGDYTGVGNSFSILTGGGNRAFINTLDDENSGSLKNYGSALSSRTGSLIFNQIKGTTLTLPGNPVNNLPTSFGSVHPVQFIPNQTL